MVYKQVLIPDKENNTFKMPEQFFGKRVEVIVVELPGRDDDENYPLDQGKNISINELLDDSVAAPDFPSINEIIDQVWPSKW